MALQNDITHEARVLATPLWSINGVDKADNENIFLKAGKCLLLFIIYSYIP